MLFVSYTGAQRESGTEEGQSAPARRISGGRGTATQVHRVVLQHHRPPVRGLAVNF